jgi:DNA adenine methylase
MNPRRPALRYFGGKWRLAPWILAHFPPHDRYVEPFGGAASVLLRKPPARLDVYNDLDRDVVAFFRTLRDHPNALIARIRLTPYSRAEFDDAAVRTGDPVEDARRFFVRSWQSRSGAGSAAPGGWRRDTRRPQGTHAWDNQAHLWDVVHRLRQVQIECDDALTILARYDTPQTLFYLDPPYVLETRARHRTTAHYAHDYTDADHRRLAEVLAGIAGMAVLSGYDSDLYRELYPDWRRVSWPHARTNGRRRPAEALWISPAAAARLDEERASLVVTASAVREPTP